VLPKVLDIQLYSSEYPGGITAEEQYEWLLGFDPEKGVLAVVPPPKLPHVVVTVTQTITLPVAYTEIVEKTVTLTSIAEEYRPEQVLAVALIALAIGIVTGYFTGKKTSRFKPVETLRCT
ncbi:MAG: hypothetical protein QXT64_04610, partial [Desulfurococcaceae archaeon]